MIYFKYIVNKLLELVFILLSFFSGGVIVAHFLKHVCKVNVIPFKWMLNDTVDGDYGGEWWLDKNDLEPSLWSAFLWWFRNPVWTFKYVIAPKPKTNKITVIKTHIHNGRDLSGNPVSVLRWVNKELRGTNFVVFSQDNKEYFRFSHTNKIFNVMIGFEKRYIFKFRFL